MKYKKDINNTEYKLNTINEFDSQNIKAKESDEDNSLERLLSELKLSGRYHVRLYFLISITFIATATQPINYIFTVENVDYRCKYEKCDVTEFTTLNKNSTVDYKCHKYDLLDQNGTCSEDNFNISSASDCTEWVYENPNSFVAEFDLGCEDWKRTLVGTMQSIGTLFGLLLLSPLADKFGRQKCIIFHIVARGVIGIAKSMLQSYWAYITFEMVEALVGDSYATLFTLAVEMITKSDRSKLIMLLSFCVMAGQIALPLVAYFVRGWRNFLLALYVPALFFILYAFWIDESLRWLLTTGKRAEAEKIIRKALKTNNMVMNESRIVNLSCEDSPSSSVLSSIKETLSSMKLLKRLSICFTMWFTSLFSSYALLINSVSLKGNQYLNFGLVALGGGVTGLVLFYVLMKFRRKGPLMLALILNGVICTSQAFVPTGYRWLHILLYMCGKMTSTISLRISYLYTTELFPTHTRSTMLGLSSSIGRLGIVVASQTPLLLKYWTGLPTLLTGVLSLGTALLVTLVPDTSEDVLPDNVKQAEDIGNKLTE